MPLNKVFLDSAYVIALAVRKDQYHQQAVQLSDALYQQGVALYIARPDKEWSVTDYISGSPIPSVLRDCKKPEMLFLEGGCVGQDLITISNSPLSHTKSRRTIFPLWLGAVTATAVPSVAIVPGKFSIHP